MNISHRMSHPHGASSFENIDRPGPSPVQSVTADTSPHMALEIKSETSGHAAQENQNQTYESKCSLFISVHMRLLKQSDTYEFSNNIGKTSTKLSVPSVF